MAILVVMATGTLWSLREPWIGALMWAWVSLMSPHVQFGYAAADWPVGQAVAIATLIGLLLTKKRQNPFVGPGVWALLAFTVWICVTLPFSMFYDQSYGLWERSMKIFLMLFVTLALIDDRRKLNLFIWVNVISLAFYGVKGGLFTIATGGNYRVWGSGGFIEGNNEVALAIITVIPLMRYLQQQMTNRWASLAMSVSMGLCAVTALGSYSRGALIGLAAMGSYFWLKSQKKLLWGVVILVVGVAALSLMPDAWWDRMDTIQSYQADASAMGRINAWWMAFNLAKSNVFGGGFMVWTRPVFMIYAPDPEDVHAAHSIYFQVMGEHGFIGLFLFLLIGACTWMGARRLIKAGRKNEEHKWAGELGAMVQVSMIGYGTAGAFLSLAYFDLPYNVMAMTMLALHFIRRREAGAAAAPREAPNLIAPQPHRALEKR